MASRFTAAVFMQQVSPNQGGLNEMWTGFGCRYSSLTEYSLALVGLKEPLDQKNSVHLKAEWFKIVVEKQLV